IVESARRHAGIIALLTLLLTLVSGFYAATHLSIDTDIDNMLPADLPWRQDDRALDKAFPQNADLLSYVRRPDGGEFFDRYGPLFLSVPELQSLSDKLVEAQPLIGTLARDPSLRGLFDTLKLFVTGAEADNDQTAIERLAPTL